MLCHGIDKRRHSGRSSDFYRLGAVVCWDITLKQLLNIRNVKKVNIFLNKTLVEH